VVSVPSRDPQRPWAPGPFTRLARTHALSVAGDTAFTVAMAGTVFFSVNDLDEARSRVALTLVFTIAPFAVAAPLIGPLVDGVRGGRRWMIIAINAARVLVAVALMRHHDSWLLYVEGLAMLVLSKGYLIARGAMVPTVVRSDDELVKANAKLTLLSGITGAVAVVPAGALLQLGPSWTLAFAALVFVGATAMAFQLPRTTVAAQPAGPVEKAELRGIGILLAASSMGLLRGIVGFLAFLLAFYAKDQDLPLLLGAAAVAAQGGFLAGSVLAPRLREVVTEERILLISLGAIVGASVAMAALLSTEAGTAATVVAAGVVSLVVGFGSNAGKQAFDSIVQRDAPDANRGRSFARFETRFQLVWVVGALIPTAIAIPLPAAFAFIGAIAAFAATSYGVGRRRASQGLDHRVIRVDRSALWSRLPVARLPGRRSRPLPPPPDAAAPPLPTLGDQSDLGPVRPRRSRRRHGPPPEAPVPGDGDATTLLGVPDVPIPGTLAAPPEEGIFSASGADEPRRGAVDPERPFEDHGVPLIEARPRWRDDPPDPA
jgi:hypothetical protein